MPSLRTLAWIGIGAVGVLALLGFGFAASTESVGVGSYNQVVIMKADRPVRRVAYAAGWVDDELRRHAEATADPRLFDWTEAERPDDIGFVARLTFTDRTNRLGQTKVYHQPHLAVYVEFEDGSSACRVVDLPSGLSGPAVTLRIP